VCINRDLFPPNATSPLCPAPLRYTALIVVAIATTVIVMATAVELASNGPLGRLPVSDVNVEPSRMFKELQA
jgi:hypothetical protein